MKIKGLKTAVGNYKRANKEGYYTQIGYAAGVYGCNGMLLQGHKTNTLYAITSRTTAIFTF